MLTGWKAFCRETGFSANTLRKLMREEGFPIQFLARHPVVTRGQIARWLKERWERNHQAGGRKG